MDTGLCADLKPIIIKHNNYSYFKMQTTQRKITVPNYSDSGKTKNLYMIFCSGFYVEGHQQLI